MKNNKLGLKAMAALLAVAIVGSFAINTKSNNLRAMEGDEGFVEEAPAEVVQEVVVVPEPEVVPEQPAEQPENSSAEEPESSSAEEPAEEVPEEPAEEEAAEEEEPFDVVAAYAHYMSLDENGKVEYLNSLSDANREELKRYIEMKEAEAKAESTSAGEPESSSAEEPAEEPEEEKTVDVRYEFVDGTQYYGDRIMLTSEISGYKNPVYQWRYSLDGVNWTNVQGANGPTYTYVLDENNCWYFWNLLVTEA